MLVSMGDSPELFRFANTGRHLESAPKESGNQLPVALTFAWKGLGMA